MKRVRRPPGARSVPALYGGLTAGLVAVVMVVASVVSPATPPSIAEFSPSARDRIEQARADQGTGPGDGGRCAPGDVRCLESKGDNRTARPGSKAGVPPPLEVAAGRRCFGDPPRQTEDPHSPPCVFEIFKGDDGGATAPGVTGTEIRVALPNWSWDANNTIGGKAAVAALITHFNRRYEFYGRTLHPIFVPALPDEDAGANRAAAEDLLATKPFGVVSELTQATNAVIHRRLAEKGVVSVVSRPVGFDSDSVVDGFTWLVDPPLDARLAAGARFACGALSGRPARHGGPEFRNSARRFAVVVVTEQSGVRHDPRPLVEGLSSCGADFEVFEIASTASDDERRTLMLNLKSGGFTTLLHVNSSIWFQLFQSASTVGYFPEWLDLGLRTVHEEGAWVGFGRHYTGGHGAHAFGFTSDVRVRPDAELPAVWALRDGGYGGAADPVVLDGWYQPLLVLASGIQGAGPNLTPATFARALRTTQFPNPNPGAPPYWQQGIGFGFGDSVFHDDYAIWWWNENARSQTSQSSSGRGSFCYLDRGARFVAESLPANADSRLFSSSEPCR